mgnify:CR=1 FL=1
MADKKAISSADRRKAAAKAYEMFRDRPGFTGLDVGYRWTEGKPTKELCIRVHVERKRDLSELRKEEVFPKTVAGVPLDVIRGPYRTGMDRLENSHDDRSAWTTGGISCGRVDNGAGTIGAVVIDETTGGPAILSNWHVMAGAGARFGDTILQPGLVDGGRPDRDGVATLSRWMLDGDGDAALATLSGARPWLPLQAGAFRTVTKARDSRLGEVLEKAGRTTGVTRARVDGEGIYRLRYEVRPGTHEVRDITGFKLVPEIPGNPENLELSKPGDSGALWMSPSDQAAVGLHFAGEANPAPMAEHAIACNITTVLSRLSARVATFEDLLASGAPEISPTPEHALATRTLGDARRHAPPPAAFAQGPILERTPAPVSVVDAAMIRSVVTDMIANRYSPGSRTYWGQTPKTLYRGSRDSWLNDFFYSFNTPLIRVFPAFDPGWDVPQAGAYYAEVIRSLRMGLIDAIGKAYDIDPWEGI